MWYYIPTFSGGGFLLLCLFVFLLDKADEIETILQLLPYPILIISMLSLILSFLKQKLNKSLFMKIIQTLLIVCFCCTFIFVIKDSYYLKSIRISLAIAYFIISAIIFYLEISSTKTTEELKNCYDERTLLWLFVVIIFHFIIYSLVIFCPQIFKMLEKTSECIYDKNSLLPLLRFAICIFTISIVLQIPNIIINIVRSHTFPTALVLCLTPVVELFSIYYYTEEFFEYKIDLSKIDFSSIRDEFSVPQFDFPIIFYIIISCFVASIIPAIIIGIINSIKRKREIYF